MLFADQEERMCCSLYLSQTYPLGHVSATLLQALGAAGSSSGGGGTLRDEMRAVGSIGEEVMLRWVGTQGLAHNIVDCNFWVLFERKDRIPVHWSSDCASNAN